MYWIETIVKHDCSTHFLSEKDIIVLSNKILSFVVMSTSAHKSSVSSNSNVVATQTVYGGFTISKKIHSTDNIEFQEFTVNMLLS